MLQRDERRMANVLPNIFKGIALFTPGGDVVYGIDPKRKAQWHSDLCIGMQKIWDLEDSPHFLVPGYTATVERWFNPQTNRVETLAEVHYPVERYIPLLQTLFDVKTTTKWHIAPWQEEHCNRAIIETYKSKFSQLWKRQDLIVRFDPHDLTNLAWQNNSDRDKNTNSNSIIPNNRSGYTLRLFIEGDRPNAEKTLNSIHCLLEEGLNSPYSLKVIDIKKNPQQAAIEQITIVPTLIRVLPKPTRRIVGQLDDIERVLDIITSL